MGKARLKNGGGGLKVSNGVLTQYVADTVDIPANTFVEHVNAGFNLGSDFGSMSNEASYADSIEVSNDRVLVVYTNPSATDSSTYRDYKYALFSVADNSMEMLTSGNVKLSSVMDGTPVVWLKKLSTDKFIVILQESTLRASIGIIQVANDNTVTLGTLTVLSNAYRANAVAINETSFLLTDIGSSTKKLNAAICTVSGNTITIGSFTELNVQFEIAKDYIIGKLTNTLYVLFFAYGSDYQCYRVLLKVSGSVITKVLSELDNSEYLSGRELVGDVFLISSSRFLVVKAITSQTTGVYLYEFTQSSITQIACLQIYNGPIYGGGLIKRALDGSFVTCVSPTPYLAQFRVSGNTITLIRAEVTRAGSSPCVSRLAHLGGRQYCIIYNKQTNMTIYLNAFPFTLNEDSVKASETDIFGITKSKITPEVAGKVWILNA